jgi:hypothetical protein
MYMIEKENTAKFSVPDAYDKIAETAFKFIIAGHLHIWIYLKDEALKFHYVEMSCMDEYFVAHYKCRKITTGFSQSEWLKLGGKLAKIYYSQKS